ncbi:hypothetical protein PV08_01835 [Exophiala spinifera]|uniref:B-block binding subunit of TFIIIC domain-containing protein n=1 Tax=Exophiala spinifera TaxID=91928 RepID=A0A0D2BS43_9EURO|nr:uncharacterized protein PV08_01835 [Exophiala spinifera]KIW21255.1 hypothetical protein PV08_01835 [Exophiala spinifera]
MAKSLDELIEFLLGEIALTGHSGLTLDGLARAVSSFYDPTHSSDGDNAPMQNPPQAEPKVNVDRLLLGKVWTWLGRHPDISLGNNKEYNNVPLDQIEFENVSDAVSETKNRVDQLQNHDNALERGQQHQSHGVHQKKRVLEKVPRIRAKENRIYQALCGHPPDATKVSPLEFDLLSQIAATRSAGMLQGELIRLSGQDKRSVPKRTDALQNKGYIIKEVVYLKGNRTSRLTLKKFAPSKSYDPDDIHRQGGQPLKGSTVRDAIRRIFDVLSQQHLVSQTQLAQQLNLESAAESTTLGKILRRLDRLKCLKRVKTATGPSATSGDVQPFVKLLHPPSPEDLQNFEVENLKLDHTLQHLSSVLEPGPLDELDARLQVSEAAWTVQHLARWNPDRNMANILMDAARLAGHTGLTNVSSRQMVTGLFVRRAIESLLARISTQSLIVQPSHLRHLAIVRTSVIVDGNAQFTHYSWDTFLQLVAEQAINVSGIPGAKQALAIADAQKSTASKEMTTKVFKNDAYGFPIQTTLPLQLKNGESDFSTLIQVAGPGDVRAKVGEPILVKKVGQKPIIKLREILPEETRVENSSPLTKPGDLRSPRIQRVTTSAKNTVAEADSGVIVKGRPRKYARGTESFWRRTFLEARLKAGISKKDIKGVMKDPAGLALYARRPADFDVTLARAIDAGLPVPQHVEDINEAWVASTKAVLDRSSNGLYITPKGLHHSNSKSQSQILIFKSSRLEEVGLRNRNAVHKYRFISSSVAHSFAYPQYYQALSKGENPRQDSNAKTSSKRKYVRSKQQPKEKELPPGGLLPEDTQSTATPRLYPSVTISRHASHDPSMRLTNEDSEEPSQPEHGSNSSCDLPAFSTPLETESHVVKLPNGNRPVRGQLEHRGLRSEKTDMGHTAIASGEQIFDRGSRLSSDAPGSSENGGMATSESSHITQLLSQPNQTTSEGEHAFERNSPVTALVKDEQHRFGIEHAVSTTSARRSANAQLQGHIEDSVPAGSGNASAVSVDSHLVAERTPTPFVARPESLLSPDIDGDFVPSDVATQQHRRRITQKRRRENTDSDSEECLAQTSRHEPSQEAVKVGALCRKIVLQLVSETSGVAPNDASTLRRVSTARWQEAGQQDRPILKTLKAAIKSLCERGKLRQVMFTHRSRTGMMLKRAVLFLPSISPNSQAVQDMKQKIIDAEPADYIPPHWRDEANRKPLIGKTVLNAASDEEETHRKRRRVSPLIDDAASPPRETRASKRRLSSSAPTLLPVNEAATSAVRAETPDPGPISTIGVPTAATGFVTLKIPRLSSLPTVQIDRWILNNPVVALRFDATPANPWKDNRTNGARSVRKPRARLNAKKVIWANDGKLDFPSTLQDILEIPDLRIQFKDVQSTDPGLQRFVSEIEAVRIWDERESQSSRRTRYAFINHLVPKALYARAVVPATIRFEALVRFDKDQREVEVPLPPTESWPFFVSILEGPTELLQHVSSLSTEPLSMQSPSALPGTSEEIAAPRARRPLKRKASEDDIDFEPEFEPKPKRQRGGARGLRSTGNNRGKVKGRVRRTERLARGTQHLRSMPEQDIYRIVIAVVVVRTLAGGLESYIDWPLVMSVFPESTKEFVADRWKTLSKKYPRDVSSLTENLQRRYLEALEANEVPSVNFENLALTDWAGIVDWAQRKLDNLNSEQIGELPDTRDEFNRTTKLSFTEPRRYHGLLGYNLNITNPAKEDLVSSLVFGHSHAPTGSNDMAQPKQMRMQYTPRFEFEMSDPTFHLAKSWALSTIMTPPQVFTPSVALAKLSRLAPTRAKRDSLLARVLKLLQDERIIQRVSKDRLGNDAVSSVRSWEPARKLFERFDERRMITAGMLRRAAAYKLDVLDPIFTRGESVVFDKDKIVDDAEMVAVLNLYNQGIVRFKPGHDVPRTRYGLEHEKVGYQTRSMDKRVLSFSVEIYPSSRTAYISGDPVMASRQARVPRGRRDDEEETENNLIPAWVDINGNVQVHLWEMFVGGVMGLVAQLPGATATEISRAITFALDRQEVELLMEWCVQAGFAKMHVKCDERPGRCLNCERFNLDCHGPRHDGGEPPPSDPASSAQVTPKRKRTFRSCRECRASKAGSRCTGERPDCLRCKRRSLVCEYEADSDPQWTRRLQAGPRASLSVPPTRTDDAQAADHPQDVAADLPSLSTRTTELSRLSTAASNNSPQGIGGLHGAPGASSRHEPPVGSRITQTPKVGNVSWLSTPYLPPRSKIRLLVKEYMDNIHPLRCYAFIHRPSFMERLDDDTSESQASNALLHIVCALGAKFYALQNSGHADRGEYGSVLSAGTEWAKRAAMLLFSNLDNVSVENLMTAVLLHDHEIRVGKHASAFILTGICARLAHALRLNLEYSTDISKDESPNGPSIPSKESRRRVMWSCYVQDALTSSGTDQLTIFHESDIKIQLPTHERNFLFQVPCVTELLQPGQFLRFLPPDAIPPRPVENMGLLAFYIRLIRIRKRVLRRYVKRLEAAEEPWLPTSEFTAIDVSLRDWSLSLPASLQLNRTAFYLRKESLQLGALILLQCTYHWTICDLYRISTPQLYRLQIRWQYPREFQDHLQTTMFQRAQDCASILRDALNHGAKILADTWLPSVAFDSNRVMIHYVTRIMGLSTDQGKTVLKEVIPHVNSNLDCLEAMQSITSMAGPFYQAARRMLIESGLGSLSSSRHIAPDHVDHDSDSASKSSREGTPNQTTFDTVLQPTSIFRLARGAVAETAARALRNETSRPPQSPTSAEVSRHPSVQHMQRPSLQPSSRGLSQAQNDPMEGLEVLHAAATVASTSTAPDDLHPFFTSWFDTGTWHNAETARATYDQSSYGLPPWMTGLDVSEAVNNSVGGTEVATPANFTSDQTKPSDQWPSSTDFLSGHI